MSLRDESLNARQLVLRQQFRLDILDAERRADSQRDAARITREQDRPNAHAVQRVDRPLSLGPDGIRDRD